MRMRLSLRPRFVGLATLAVVAAVALLLVPAAFSNTPVNGAAFSTTNTATDGSGHCKNGNEDVNCNIYDGKQYVWLNGGPSVAYVGDGEYFFAVLAPGGQADPNDGSARNLSDDYDAYSNRTFSVSGGTVGYSGGHDFDNNKIRLADYADTTNLGGVYILAICSLADGYPVDASDCKYDAFKIRAGEEVTAAPLTVTKDASGSYDDTFTWGISKSADKTSVKQVGGSAAFTYTVHVTHDGGSISDVKVSGTITVFNPNLGSAVVDVTDQLSDGTVCTVTGGGGAIVTTGDNDFSYSCDLVALPSGTLDNVATVSWAEQTLDPDGPLAPGSDDFTFDDVAFAGTNVDDCTTVTDPVPSGGSSSDNPFPATVCVGDSNDGGAGTGAAAGFTFAYHTTYNVGTGCANYDNTATESTDGNYSSVRVTVCGPANNSALTIGFWKGPNGNSLIQNYCAPVGKTSLASYLSSLGGGSGPFADAAGKTCGQLVTYVNNVIKAASATNMNVMLKAQMLATALDVYFSDPNLGYKTTSLNKTKPPSTFLTQGSLGLFTMDLTAVCPMVDNTISGSASCKNSTPSTNGFASGAVPQASMTIQAILNFASTTPSPFNGSTANSVWYGGNRTLEEVLKNIFDQINNNAAFAP
jgi:hypothetical protein